MQSQKSSQVPQPTCFWKWVGRTNPQKSGILTLEVCFSAKKNSTVKSSTELGRVIQYLQILPSGNIFKNFTWPRRPFDSHPPVWPPLWSHWVELDFLIFVTSICQNHISDLWTGNSSSYTDQSLQLVARY